MSKLLAPACSIAPTRRRRFLWAAWWSGPPTRDPFRSPDASSGGARTPEDALREAERACGAPLVLIEPLWARAWARVLRGEPAFARGEGEGARVGTHGANGANGATGAEASPVPAQNASVWEVLGVPPNASIDEVKRAYRQRALATHPDRGGDAEAFRAVQRAYEQAALRKAKAAARPHKRRPPV